MEEIDSRILLHHITHKSHSTLIYGVQQTIWCIIQLLKYPMVEYCYSQILIWSTILENMLN